MLRAERPLGDEDVPELLRQHRRSQPVAQIADRTGHPGGAVRPRPNGRLGAGAMGRPWQAALLIGPCRGVAEHPRSWRRNPTLTFVFHWPATTRAMTTSMRTRVTTLVAALAAVVALTFAIQSTASGSNRVAAPTTVIPAPTGSSASTGGSSGLDPSSSSDDGSIDPSSGGSSSGDGSIDPSSGGSSSDDGSIDPSSQSGSSQSGSSQDQA